MRCNGKERNLKDWMFELLERMGEENKVGAHSTYTKKTA